MLVQDTRLEYSLSVDDALADLKRLRSAKADPSAAALLAIGRSLLPPTSTKTSESGPQPISVRDLASFEKALDSISAPGAQEQDANQIALAAARFYVSTCRRCLQLNTPSADAATTTPNLDQLQKEIATVQARSEEAATQLSAAIRQLENSAPR